MSCTSYISEFTKNNLNNSKTPFSEILLCNMLYQCYDHIVTDARITVSSYLVVVFIVVRVVTTGFAKKKKDILNI